MSPLSCKEKIKTMKVKLIDIILPIYKGIEDTKNCLDSIYLEILKTSCCRLILINDASPEKSMKRILREYAASFPIEKIKLIENEVNLGFVKTVNKGFQNTRKDADVLLLNSDTIATKGFLQELQKDAYSKEKVGTVTPFSNNATICSFPNFCEENSLLKNFSLEEINRIWKRNRLECIPAPTGVGFCMYITRECLDKVGYLNEKEFKRGYGEENDFCQRAIKLGFSNLISPNLFVFHKGSVSFDKEKNALIEQALKTIDRLHPNYHADVSLFCRNDPVKPQREERILDLLLQSKLKKIIHVSHALGGGTQQNIDELIDYYRYEAIHIVTAPQINKKEIDVTIIHDQICLKFKSLSVKKTENVKEFFEFMNPDAVHIHHLYGYNRKFINFLSNYSSCYFITAHDYYMLNGNPTLTNNENFYIGYYDPDTSEAASSLKEKNETLADFQNLFTKIFRKSTVIFPSYACEKIFTSADVYHPKKAFVAYHLEKKRQNILNINSSQEDNNLKVCAIGAISEVKGSNFLEKLAELATLNNLDISFKIIGFANRSLNKVECSGVYNNIDLFDILSQEKPDIIFFANRCPETYNYVLSHVLNTNLPIFAPTVGSFSERLKGRKNSYLYNYQESPQSILEQLIIFSKKIQKDYFIEQPISIDISGFYNTVYLKLIKKRNYKKYRKNNYQLMKDSQDYFSLSNFLFTSYKKYTPRKIKNKIPKKLKIFAKNILYRFF